MPSLLSSLLVTTITGLRQRRRMSATWSSRLVTPFLMSTTKRITSASSMASCTCLLISPSKISSEFTTQPPVSTTDISMPFHSIFPYWRSRVVPLVSSTMAARVCVSRLNKVDLPTLGRPTIATKRPMMILSVFCCCRYSMYPNCLSFFSWLRQSRSTLT